MVANMKEEIKRVKGFQSGDFTCLRCHRSFYLHYNGGELDQVECCGLVYQTEHVQIDLVIREKE